MNSAGKDSRQEGTLERTGRNRRKGEKDRPGAVTEEMRSEMSVNSPEESGGQEKDGKGIEEASSRSLPGELYNFYNMEQYRTPGKDEPVRESCKQVDIWLQEFDKQVIWLNYRLH